MITQFWVKFPCCIISPIFANPHQGVTIPCCGGAHVVDVDPFHNVHAAGYRSVVDFADPDSSVFVTSTGQSGHFLSRHYDDLGQLWRLGEYVPMSLDPRLARAAATGITTITR